MSFDPSKVPPPPLSFSSSLQGQSPISSSFSPSMFQTPLYSAQIVPNPISQSHGPHVMQVNPIDKVISTIKKNKPLDKLLNKLGYTQQEQKIQLLIQVFSSSDSVDKALQQVVKLENENFCPLTKRLIRIVSVCHGVVYEAAAIKEYVIKYNETPDHEPVTNVTLPPVDSLFSSLLKPNEKKTKEIQKYATTKLQNIVALLSSKAEQLINRQTDLVNVLVSLLDLLRPSNQQYRELIGSLFFVLDEYTELTSALLNELPKYWERDSVSELQSLLKLTSYERNSNVFASVTSTLAKLCKNLNDFDNAKRLYDDLYRLALADEYDWKDHVWLLINKFWSDDIPNQYPDSSFHKVLLEAGYESNRDDVVIAASLALARSASKLEEKVSYLVQILKVRFDQEQAQQFLVNLAQQIAASSACQPYFQILSQVLLFRGLDQTLSDLYGQLKPKEVLSHPDNIPFLSRIASNLYTSNSTDLAVEAYNLLAKLYLDIGDNHNSSIYTQFVLDSLDMTNQESMDRLTVIAANTNKLSLSAKYKVRNVINDLAGSEIAQEKKTNAVIAIGSLLSEFENKIENGGGSAQLLAKIEAIEGRLKTSIDEQAEISRKNQREIERLSYELQDEKTKSRGYEDQINALKNDLAYAKSSSELEGKLRNAVNTLQAQINELSLLYETK